MGNVVLQMMTTLNGRLDDPGAWVVDVGSDLYDEIDRRYEAFDTILVGSTTCEEMIEFWPQAAEMEGASPAQQRMAKKMNTYHKFVFSRRTHPTPPAWNNAAYVTAADDDALVGAVNRIKANTERDIHLAGGAELAQSILRLGLVDEYRFFVHPVLSEGQTWHPHVGDERQFELLSATAYQDGVVALYYRPRR